MKFVFSENGWEDFAYWIETDIALVKKIKELLHSIRSTPFKGIGRPESESLKHNLRRYWSRRITQEHRLVYRITGNRVSDQTYMIIQCRFHYE